MRVKLGATVKTNDGHRAGEVAKAVWDPERNEVGEFVVRTGGLLGHDVLISRDVLESAATEDDELVVDLSKRELEGLSEYDARGYAPPPYGWLAPAEATYAAQEFLFPVVNEEPRATNAAADRPRLAIRKGMAVKDASGQHIGEVEELRIDDMTGELRAIALRGSGDDATREIPADQLDVGGDEVHVIDAARARDAR